MLFLFCIPMTCIENCKNNKKLFSLLLYKLLKQVIGTQKAKHFETKMKKVTLILYGKKYI